MEMGGIGWVWVKTSWLDGNRCIRAVMGVIVWGWMGVRICEDGCGWKWVY